MRRSLLGLQFANMGGFGGGGKDKQNNNIQQLLHDAQQQQKYGSYNQYSSQHIMDESPYLNMKDMLPMFRQQAEQLTGSRMDLNTIKEQLCNSNPGPGGGFGMMAFGVGQDERGKRVARGATMMRNSDGTVTRDFMEQQLDPDDPMLPKEAVDRYDTSDAIEVELEEQQPSSSIAKPLEEFEVEIETVTDISKKK